MISINILTINTIASIKSLLFMEIKYFLNLITKNVQIKKTGITNIKFRRILYVTEIYIRSMNGPESRDTNDYSSRRFQNHPINKRLKTYVEQRILSSIFKDAN